MTGIKKIQQVATISGRNLWEEGLLEGGTPTFRPLDPPRGWDQKQPVLDTGCCRGEQWNPEALDLYGVLECGGQATVGWGGSGTLDHSSSSFFFNTTRGSHTGSFLRPPGGSPPLTHVGRNPGKDRLWRAVENTHKKPSKSPFLVWTF